MIGVQLNIDIIDDEDLDNVSETGGSSGIETKTNSGRITHAVADCNVIFFSDVFNYNVTGSVVIHISHVTIPKYERWLHNQNITTN